MASLDDLTAATEELSAPAQMHLQPPLLCQLTFTLPGPRLLPSCTSESQPHSGKLTRRTAKPFPSRFCAPPFSTHFARQTFGRLQQLGRELTKAAPYYRA